MPGHKHKFRSPFQYSRAAYTAPWFFLLALTLGTGSRCQEVASSVPVPDTKTEVPSSPPVPVSETPSASSDDPETIFPHLTDTRYWLSGQANFIYQTNPPFYAAYSGKNSFVNSYDKATSRVLTLYTGMRLNESLEVIADVEESGGAALSKALGIAGFPDLDVVRNPFLSKAPYLARGMIVKVIGLSDEKIENERTALSLFGEVPRRRLEIGFGKFGMVDFFDLNSVGSDSHFQFMNWSTCQNGAYDFAADTRGYTVGFIVDYEDKNWGLLFGEGLMPKVANGMDLVWKIWQAHADNFQFELRRGVIPKQAGIVRLLAYTNYANMGIYTNAVEQYEQGLVPAPEITDHPWQITRKYGFGINLEQNLSSNLTAFGRFGWNNGKTESFAYTEIDETFSGGLGANGGLWHRRHDRAGIAFATNAISKDHQRYLADGGYGFILGDGALRYGRENILETYYTAHVWRGIYVAPDLQYIVNPGYNRDRGPVLVPSFRVHFEF